MSNKQNIKLENKLLFFKDNLEKREAFELYIFDERSKKHIATVKGKSRNICLEKANNLFDRFEFIFSFNDQNQYELKVINKPFKLYIFPLLSR